MTTVKIDIDQLGGALSAMKSLAAAIDSARHSAMSGSPVGLPSLADNTLGQKSRYLSDHVADVQAIIDLGNLLATDGAKVVSYDGYDGSLTEVRQRLGAELAKKAKDLDQSSNPQEWQKYGDVLARYKGDHAVMASMYNTLGPEGTAKVLKDLSWVMGQYTMDPNLAQIAKDVREGLAAASQNVTYDQYARPDFDGAGFARALVDTFTNYNLDDRASLANQNVNPGILAFLLDGVDYSDAFLSSAASELDAFEQQSKDNVTLQQFYRLGGMTPFTGLMTNPPRQGYWADPMASVMNAFSRNPAAGFAFFTGNADRQEWYFNNREWKADGYQGVSAAADKITTNIDLLKQNASEVTKLASAFVHGIHDNPGFTKDDAKGASPYIGELLKFYAGAVQDSLDGSPTASSKLPGNYTLPLHGLGSQTAPIFAEGELKDLVAVGMSTTDGMQLLAEGEGSLRGAQLKSLARQFAGTTDPRQLDALQTQMQSVLVDGAALDGFFQHAAGEANIQDAKDAAQKQAAWASMVSDAIDFVPVPGAAAIKNIGGDVASKLGEYAWNKGTELGQNTAMDLIFGSDGVATATASAEERATQSYNQMTFHTYQSLAQAGVVQVPSVQLPDGATVAMPPSWSAMQALEQVHPGASASIIAAASQAAAGIVPLQLLHSSYEDEFHKYFD